jgi:hypothetical protein
LSCSCHLCFFLVLLSGQYFLIEWVCCFLCFQFLEQFWNQRLSFFKCFVAFTFSVINLLLQYCSLLSIPLHFPSVSLTSIPTFPFMVTYYMKMGTRYFHSLISIFLFTELQTLSQAHQLAINTPFWLQGGLRTWCYIRSWTCCTSVGGESCESYCLPGE